MVIYFDDYPESFWTTNTRECICEWMNGTEENIYVPTTGIGGQDQDGDVKGGGDWDKERARAKGTTSTKCTIKS